MTTLVLEIEPRVTALTITSKKMTVALADGRCLIVPLDWYPRLVTGTPAERKHWRLLGQGYAIEWPDLDEHIGIEGLLAGQRSGESQQSFNRWLMARKEKAALNRPGKGKSKNGMAARIQAMARRGKLPA